MTSSESREPQGSERSSTECAANGGGPHCFHRGDGKGCCFCGIAREELEAKKPILRCKCGHHRIAHEDGKYRCGAGRNGTCGCQLFLCDHSRCGWKPREEKPQECPPGVHSIFDPCPGDCSEPVEDEPPMTPEEEEQAPEDEGCPHCPDGHQSPERGSQPWSAWVSSERDGDGQPMQITVARSAGAHVAESDAQWVRERLNAPREELPLDHPARRECRCSEAGVCRNCAERPSAAFIPPPPQPDRRPPYAIAYSVQGHLYEVALPGDATVRAVDGALVIQHHLGPVAGIVQVLPIVNEERA